jgi:FMN-dependent NADH-azoreductase
MAATCTVTYVDPQQLLACGHPLLQAGPVSLPMTKAEVITTLASPMNSFKIINTGSTIGAFNQDRDAAIRGNFGAQAHMIPVHIRVHGAGATQDRRLNLEVLDLPAMTPQAILVSVYNALLQSNDSSEETSYHLTGSIHMENYSPMPLNLWALSGDGMPAPMEAALLVGERFLKIYANSTRQSVLQSVDLDAEAIPRHVDVELASARIVSGDIVHAGDTVVVEATLRPWRQSARNVRLSFVLPARLASGNLRLLVSDATTLDHTLDQPRQSTHATSLETVLTQAHAQHPADRVYLSLLAPETQAALDGRALPGLPLSVANALEPQRNSQDASLNGESAEFLADSPADGVLIGFTLLNLRIEPGGGLD